MCPFEDLDKRPSSVGDGGPSQTDAGPETCEDPFEPNDLSSGAAPVEVGVHAAAICPEGDADWFLLDVQEPSHLAASLRFVHAEGDLDLELVGPLPSLERVAVSQGVGDVEQMTGPVAPGAWLLHVFGFGRAQNPYELELRLEPEGATCQDDELEENDSAASATPLPLAEPVQAAFCPGSPDWYGVDVDAGLRVVAELLYEPGQDLSLQLRRPQSGVVASSETGSGVERVEYPVAVDGAVNVIVDGSLDVPEARPYNLVVRTESMGCGEDEHEDNDTPDEATLVEIGPTQTLNRSGRTCAGELDFFRLSWVPTAFFLNVTLVGGEGLVGTVLREEDLSLVGDVSPGTTLVLYPQQEGLSPGGVLFLVSGLDGAASYTASFSAPAED